MPDIYSGVPIPEGSVGAPKKYNFEEMKPGDHFLWKCGPDESVSRRASSISTAAKQRGYNVKTRSDGNIIKVWMVGPVDAKTS